MPLVFNSATLHSKQLRPFTKFTVYYIPGILLSTSGTYLSQSLLNIGCPFPFSSALSIC